MARDNKILGVDKFVKKAKMIFDIGSGPNGSPWWKEINKDTKVDGIDTYFFPNIKPKNITVYKYDASKLNEIKNNQIFEKHIFKKLFVKTKTNLIDKYDLVVASHVLEHVQSPENLIKGISKIIKKGGTVYTGFPDGYNFTDIFYHLIHQDGGGHIQRLKKNDIISIFKKYGFKLTSAKDWPDDWLWLEKCFDFKGRGIKYFDQEGLNFLANTFRKELTLSKGYNYGWELIFKKI